MHTSPIIRTASLSERDNLNDIKVRVSLMWPDFRRRLLDDPDWIGIDEQHINDGRVLVIESLGETLGYLTVQSRSDGDAEIDGLFIDPSQWGSNIPRILIDAAANFAREDGADHLWVITTEAAVAFFETLDFERAGHDNSAGGASVSLLRSLSDTIGNA